MAIPALTVDNRVNTKIIEQQDGQKLNKRNFMKSMAKYIKRFKEVNIFIYEFFEEVYDFFEGADFYDVSLEQNSVLLKEASASVSINYLFPKKMIPLKRTQELFFSTLIAALRHMNGPIRSKGTSVEAAMMWLHEISGNAYAVETIFLNIAATNFAGICLKENKTNSLEANEDTIN